MPANIVLKGLHYEAYVTVIAGEGDGPLIYIDSHGHIHGPIPEGPEATRLKQVATQHAKSLQAALGAIATEFAR
jgi:hypothetical protein